MIHQLQTDGPLCAVPRYAGSQASVSVLFLLTFELLAPWHQHPILGPSVKPSKERKLKHAHDVGQPRSVRTCSDQNKRMLRKTQLQAGLQDSLVSLQKAQCEHASETVAEVNAAKS